MTYSSYLASNPIGIFDSGIGGISLLNAGRSRLPLERWIYVADMAYLPYGDKDYDLVRRRASIISEFLIASGVKAILVACNTATAISIDHLRSTFPKITFIGVEPAIKPAVMLSKAKVIGILATGATTESDRMVALVKRFCANVNIIIQPCPGLAELIERGETKSNEAYQLIRKFVLPMREKGADVIALGCTHYAFASNLIRKVAGNSIQILDTSLPVITELTNQLSKKNLLSAEKRSSVVEVWSTNTEGTKPPMLVNYMTDDVPVKNIKL